MPNLAKIFQYIKCYRSNSPRPITNPSHSIRYNCQKISVEWEDKKPLWKFHFMQWTGLFLTCFSKANRAIAFSSTIFFYILNYRKHIWSFRQSGKQDSLRYILKSSTSMYASSGSQSLRTITWTQSVPDSSTYLSYDLLNHLGS